MSHRVFLGFLIFTGIIFACRFGQPQTVPFESTSTIQYIQLPPPEITFTPEKLIQPMQASPSEITINVLPGFDLQIPRSMHTATLLPNGKILLVGGSLEPDDFVADEELFDPATGTSSWIAPLHTKRHGHTATLLPDGRVLVVGGYSLPQQWLDDAEVYDPASDTWTVLPSLFKHGVSHSATLMKDGRVLVVGGCIDSGVCTEKVEIFNPKTNSWVNAQPLKLDRASHIAQLLIDGRVLIAGGAGATNDRRVDGDGVVYDPEKNTWTATGPMSRPRIFAQSVLLPNGQVLAASGILLEDSSNQVMTNSVEVYDPISNTWAFAANMAEARYAFILILQPNGQVLAVGGVRNWDNSWDDGSFVHEIEVYDPQTDQWHIAGAFPQPRAFATGILLPNGSVWVAGGQFGQSGTTFPLVTWLIVTTKP
jgi:N-acetylneuraminic acid mutarotase